MVALVRTSGSSKDVYGVLTDRQGSLRALYNASGVVQRFSYDAWGNRRSISGGSLTDSEKASLNSITSRGYTLHEHMDEFGLINMNARLYDPQLGMFVSTDPKASDYYNTYPYSYCSGDPLNRVDPTGEDEWYLDAYGNVVKHVETDEHDAFYFVGRDENVIPGKSFTLKYGTVELSKTEYYHLKRKSTNSYVSGYFDYYRVRGDDNAKELFEFLSEGTAATNVEWSHIMAGIEGEEGLNYITTSHTEKYEAGMPSLWNTQFYNGYTLRVMNHSHPNYFENSKADMDFKNGVYEYKIENGFYPIPIFRIYHVPSKKYFVY
ncbi:MAG: hypothetical protein IKK07_01245 [Bacteroides sp.]|nr:hypothetical protein [Bacteroides sp.]